MELHFELLQTPEQIQALATELRKVKVIAFDTEFIRENTFFPQVEIIQVATRDQAWLVDAQAFIKKESKKNGTRDPSKSGPTGIEPLLEVFKDPSILKIVHAAQGDQECLFTAFDTLATPTFDTSVGASLCGYGDAVGLGNLLKSFLGITINKGHARTDWSARPLQQQLLEYALADVQYLVDLGEKLLEHLDGMGRRAWSLELTGRLEDPKLYASSPEEIAQRLARGGRLDKKGYAALVELVKWREHRVRTLNLPRRWVADDHVLVDLAHVRPKDMAHLATFRGLSKGEIKNSGDELLAALKRGSEAKEINAPKFTRPDVATDEESQIMEVLKCYLGILSNQHKIAMKHLLTVGQLLPLLRSGAKTPEDLVNSGLLSAGAARLVGNELIALIDGKRALRIRNRQIEVVSLDS